MHEDVDFPGDGALAGKRRERQASGQMPRAVHRRGAELPKVDRIVAQGGDDVSVRLRLEGETTVQSGGNAFSYDQAAHNLLSYRCAAHVPHVVTLGGFHEHAERDGRADPVSARNFARRCNCPSESKIGQYRPSWPPRGRQTRHPIRRSRD
jgi:hypothetical protein